VSISQPARSEQRPVLSEEERCAAVRLLVEYARFIDDADGAAWSALFGEGGVLAVGENEISGKQELAAFAENSPRGVHIQGEATFQRRPDGSIDSQSSFIFARAADGGVVAGWYTDCLARHDGRIVFARRHIDIRVRPLPPGVQVGGET
jgi:SnoaL-like domain